MDQRQRWQALQSHLASARACLDAGDRHGALQHVDAALAIDPDFLAALSLRDRLATVSRPPLSPAREPAVAPVTMPEPVAPPAIPEPIVAIPTAEAAPEAPAPAPSATIRAERPLVSVEGYAQFEERAKRRRVDRRIDAARAAIAGRRLKDAASALNEIIELDPNLPELSVLTAEFDELRRTAAPSHRGPWLAAAATFVACVLGATWLQESAREFAPPLTVATALPEPAAPIDTAPAVEPLPATPIATTGSPAPPADAIPDIGVPDAIRADTKTTPSAVPLSPAPPPAQPRRDEDVPTRASAAVDSAAASPAPDVTVARMTTPIEPPPPAANVQPINALAAPPPPAPAVVPAAATALPPSSAPADRTTPAVASPAPTVDDDRLVRDTLQRYRSAYEGLDAGSARAVWPAVNEAALARAFDGLESQELVFDACTVQLRGETAAAVCRGTAKYVPKVGNRDPHVEPRTWSFTLRKAAGEWTIQSARAQR